MPAPSLPSPFASIPGIKSVAVADKSGLRCTGVLLNDKTWCFYSPVATLAKNQLAVSDLRCSYLFAPNHYHHKAIQEYKECLNGAKPCTTKDAKPRLERVTSLKFVGSSGLERKLPANVELIQTVGLKTGEAWLKVRGTQGITWVVCDAFCGPTTKTTKPFASAPQLLKPFPKFGVGDRDEYIEWVSNEIEQDQPTTLIPCHGAMVSSPALPGKLLNLVRKKL